MVLDGKAGYIKVVKFNAGLPAAVGKMVNGIRRVVDSAQQGSVVINGNTLVVQQADQSSVLRVELVSHQKLGFNFQPQRIDHSQFVQAGQFVDHHRCVAFRFIVEFQAAQTNGIHMRDIF